MGCLTSGAPNRALFRLSPNQVKVFDRDLAFARIGKRGARGRTVCTHSLRHAFATLLSLHGVAPPVAQAAMQHSQVDLTMGVYSDPRLPDVAAVMDALRALIAIGSQEPECVAPAHGYRYANAPGLC